MGVCTPARQDRGGHATAVAERLDPHGELGEDDEKPLERFFPEFFSVIGPRVMATMPELIALHEPRRRASRGAPGEGRRSLDELLEQVGTILADLTAAVMPTVIELVALNALRLGDGRDGDVVDELAPELLGAVTAEVARHLPTALRGMGAGTAAGPSIVGDETARRWLGPVAHAFTSSVASSLPRLFDVVNGRMPSTVARLSWPAASTGERLWDGERISVIRHRPIDDPAAVEVGLHLAGHLHADRRLSIEDACRRPIAEIGVGGGTREARTRLDADAFLGSGGALMFERAQGSASRVAGYRLAVAGHAAQFRGMEVTFQWS